MISAREGRLPQLVTFARDAIAPAQSKMKKSKIRINCLLNEKRNQRMEKIEDKQTLIVSFYMCVLNAF